MRRFTRTRAALSRLARRAGAPVRRARAWAAASPLVRRWHARGAKSVRPLCWAYAAAILIVVILLGFAGDRWWPATLLMFGPRWVWLAPLAVLLPATLLLPPGRRRRRFAWLPLGTLAAVLWLVMGLCVPWRSVADGAPTPADRLRILTCNIDGSALDADRLRDVLIDARPDVVVLQAWSSRYQQTVFGDLGWHFRRDDELFIASQFPIRAAEPIADPRFSAGPGAAARYELDLPGGRTLAVINLHLATPRDALTHAIARSSATAREMRANSELRQAQCDAVGQWAGGDADPMPVVIAGDFNTPAESRIFPAAFADYDNAFTRAGWGWGRTHFTRRTAVRIDHVLCGPGVRARNCWVGPDVGSAHRPVIAEVELIGRGADE